MAVTEGARNPVRTEVVCVVTVAERPKDGVSLAGVVVAGMTVMVVVVWEALVEAVVVTCGGARDGMAITEVRSVRFGTVGVVAVVGVIGVVVGVADDVIVGVEEVTEGERKRVDTEEVVTG